jgi:hypothetical protein
MENQITTDTEKILSESMIQNIRTSAPWMKFFAIVAFISAGLLVIFGIYSFAQISNYGYRVNTTPLLITAFIYIIIAIIMCVLGSYLLKSADGYSSYARSKDPASLEKALLMQKKYWQTAGIVTIVYLSLLVIALLIYISASSSHYYY